MHLLFCSCTVSKMQQISNRQNVHKKELQLSDCFVFMRNIEASLGLRFFFVWSSNTGAAAGLKQLGLLHTFSYDVQKGVF